MRLWVLIFAVLLLAACSKYKGFSEIDQGICYKLHLIGEHADSINDRDFVLLHLSYATIDDSVFYSKRIKFQVADSAGNLIDKAVQVLSDGDSASFIVSAQQYFVSDLGVDVPSFLSNEFKLNVKVEEVQRYSEYLAERERFLAWAQDFKEYERVFLKQYVLQNSISTDLLASGMHKIVLDHGDGMPPLKGDTVNVQYAGKFLNGKFFDSDSENKRQFQFVLGTEWQVIEGLESAIKNMQEGERSLFIMPSDLAFGSKGSSTGIVPPYTSVVFEVQLDRVAQGDSVAQNNVL